MTVSPDSETGAFAEALSVEHAAVFAYGVVGAFANPARAGQIAVDVAAHRARRDTVIDLLHQAGAEAPVAAAGYALPFPVTDPFGAAQLAAQVESDTAVAWRAVVEHSDSADSRRTALEALTDAATREALWRSALGTDPTTAAFPGQP
ncbi:ferritin-like domain-containing protein [Rhodococcus triatomae]|uniref:Uncharacterized protein n=1 Tax=Rhodococcus triatomae TaxID=300028 RepID=A0A1G8Q7F9_9NOCA|nr:ferritin-like domain-containing protein [Rhodococcus triatomae]QNG19166.1 ferritin-like domain-containing protein [Rhodococcus triatomae]QNG24922.1 ferritin-like domain-containing protein [Rhodococcus triatomae]SDJ00621.1 protein of unknown function [Rhodococcus triatomae]